MLSWTFVTYLLELYDDKVSFNKVTPHFIVPPSSPVSRQWLLWTNLHKFLCIDHSFLEAVLYSFSKNLVEATPQPVP